MNYIVSRLPCRIVEGDVCLLPNVRYKLTEQPCNLTIEFGGCTFVVGLEDNKGAVKNPFCEVVKFNHHLDCYIFLFFKNPFLQDVEFLKLNNANIFVSISNKLKVSINSVCQLEEEVEGITFSHTETRGNFGIIYFSGKRGYVVIIKDNVICGHGYYDEVNSTKEEIYFMCKLSDSINHGRVMHISNNAFEQYLVYLDNFELNLKPEFVHLVFLDCLICGNLKYCNALLDETIKQENEKEIKNFFAEFDFYFPLKENAVALFKKNALAGIYEFEIENCKVKNIVCL